MLAVFALTFLAFLPCLRNGFVDYDDPDVLLDVLQWRGLGPAQLRWMWSTLHFARYMPLSWMSLGLDYTLWGLDPRGYHLTAMLLHAATAAALFGLARRFFSGPADARRANLCAAFAALAWSLHPLRVEPVAWASQRRDLVSGLFYVLAASAYLDGRARLSFLYYVFSLLGKEIGLTFPLILAALDVYPLRRLSPDPRRWTEPGVRRVWLEKLPFAAAAAASGAAAFWAEARLGALAPLGEFSVHQRLAQSAWAMLFYLWKTLWPSGLHALYLAPAELDPWSPPFLAGQAAAALLLWTLWRDRRARPAPWTAFAAYVFQLLPVLGAAKFGLQLAADRFSYLPGMTLAILAGAGLARSGSRRAAPLLACAVLAALAALTWRQCGYWKDSDALWNRALAVNPAHAVALNNLGVEAARRGEVPEALGYFEKAAQARPSYVLALDNLGLTLVRAGRTEDARRVFSRALELQPRSALLRAHAALAENAPKRGR
ncbi:MAG TPA: tetratricopeptide repeat protein [Elusimicrobiota bacterium]|nr:tetratricopeptide repeat protein [Elusimicrobiota bacterium]